MKDAEEINVPWKHWCVKASLASALWQEKSRSQDLA